MSTFIPSHCKRVRLQAGTNERTVTGQLGKSVSRQGRVYPDCYCKEMSFKLKSNELPPASHHLNAWAGLAYIQEYAYTLVTKSLPS